MEDPKQQRGKIIARAIGFSLPLAIFVIVMGIAHGGLSSRWMDVANGLFYVTLAIIALGVVSWVVLRLRARRRKA
jgi:uncharacterized transporter YbjL